MSIDVSLEVVATEAIEALKTDHKAILVVLSKRESYRFPETSHTLVFEYFPSLQ